jgi:chitodextrinase
MRASVHQASLCAATDLEPILTSTRHSLSTTALAAAVMGLFSLAAPAASQAAPTPLKNVLHGNDRCLAWQPGGETVTFAACDGGAAQDWVFQKQNDGTHLIRNRAAIEQGAERCLRTHPDGSTGRVALGTCKGDGYTSMRSWRVNAGLGDQLALSNKYRADAGRTELLSASTDAPGVTMRADAGGTAAATFTYPLPLPLPDRPYAGDKSALLLVAHFSDSKPADAETVRKAVFGDGDEYASLRRYLEVASHGKLRLRGETLDSVDLGKRPATCDSSAILAAARDAARIRGVNPDKFDHLFVDLPKMSNCGWAGLAATPGNWILSNNSGSGYWMWTHEFGHNLGANHPVSLIDCPTPGGTVEVGAACRVGKVDDPSDTMGGGGRRLYPGSYQLFTGWLGANDVPEIRDAGAYTLAPLFGDRPGARGYRIKRSDGTLLWLEFRQPLRGFDDWKANDPFVNGVIVRIVEHKSGKVLNTLVDATPGSANGMKDAPLMPGHSLHDTLSGKIITVSSLGPDGAVVEVRNDGLLLPEASITGPQQADANATVTLSGAASVGERLQYQWRAPVGITLKPAGSSASFVAPAADKERDYAFGLTVTNDKGYAANATHVVKVKAQETVAPPRAAISGPANAAGGERVTLSGAQSTGKGLGYAWTSLSGVALTQNGANASFVAPKAEVERNHDFRLTVTDELNRKSEAVHRVTVRADAGQAVPAWEAKRTYATPCEKVAYGGKTWMNGWWVLGDVPGQGGEWGPWRELGVANMHGQCKGK